LGRGKSLYDGQAVRSHPLRAWGNACVLCHCVCGVGWDWGGRGESKILSNLERGAAKSFAVPLAQRAKGKGWLAFLVLLSNCVTPTERVDVVVRSGSVRKVVAR